jgi:hypothetical protein
MAYRVSCAHATTWFRYKAVSQKLNDTGGVKKRCPGRRGRRKRPGQEKTGNVLERRPTTLARFIKVESWLSLLFGKNETVIVVHFG